MITFWSAFRGISNFESNIFLVNYNLLQQFAAFVVLTEISLKLQSVLQKLSRHCLRNAHQYISWRASCDSKHG